MTSAIVPSLDTLRVDIVGSFLRTPALKAAATAHVLGTLPDDEITAVQDEAIVALIAEEERHGLPIVSDGEFRTQRLELVRNVLLAE
jgi:methionine synthase II (cobalamin-independent)